MELFWCAPIQGLQLLINLALEIYVGLCLEIDLSVVSGATTCSCRPTKLLAFVEDYTSDP